MSRMGGAPNKPLHIAGIEWRAISQLALLEEARIRTANASTTPAAREPFRGPLSGREGVLAIRRLVKLTQQQFADPPSMSVHTMRNLEQRRRNPEGPARWHYCESL
jgi:DNA-binding transcriptional regulator YiaG